MLTAAPVTFPHPTQFRSRLHFSGFPVSLCSNQQPGFYETGQFSARLNEKRRFHEERFDEQRQLKEDQQEGQDGEERFDEERRQHEERRYEER
jgi:hypothetical protein